MSNWTEVKLTWFEIMHAAIAGVCRNVSALRDGRPLEEGREDTGFGRHADGAIAELAVAKHLGEYWQPAMGRLDTEDGDLAQYHVKATTRPNGSLIVRPHDPTGFEYVLVILDLPTARIIGKMSGAEAKTPQFWRERNPSAGVHRAAYFVPQDRLVEL